MDSGSTASWMSTPRTAPDQRTTLRFLSDLQFRFAATGAWPRALACAWLAATLAVAGPPDLARAASPAALASAEEPVILTVRANGVERGEFTLLRQADGDFWVAAADLPRLK